MFDQIQFWSHESLKESEPETNIIDIIHRSRRYYNIFLIKSYSIVMRRRNCFSLKIKTWCIPVRLPYPSYVVSPVSCLRKNCGIIVTGEKKSLFHWNDRNNKYCNHNEYSLESLNFPLQSLPLCGLNGQYNCIRNRKICIFCLPGKHLM